jgi:hypothetical protein
LSNRLDACGEAEKMLEAFFRSNLDHLMGNQSRRHYKPISTMLGCQGEEKGVGSLFKYKQ